MSINKISWCLSGWKTYMDRSNNKSGKQTVGKLSENLGLL